MHDPIHFVTWTSQFSLRGFEQLNYVSVRNQATENASPSIGTREAAACDRRGRNVPDALPSLFPSPQDPRPPDNQHHHCRSCAFSNLTQSLKVWFISFTFKGYPKIQQHKKNFFSFFMTDSATIWMLLAYLLDNYQLLSLYLVRQGRTLSSYRISDPNKIPVTGFSSSGI